jgi:hypothetical protein
VMVTDIGYYFSLETRSDGHWNSSLLLILTVYCWAVKHVKLFIETG